MKKKSTAKLCRKRVEITIKICYDIDVLILSVRGLFMKKLEYSIEDRTIAEILGVQNFTNAESAVLELVKNAFDACAKEIFITIHPNEMIFEDNGTGMSAQTIIQNWMHIGKSDKDYTVTDGKDVRVLAGSKGVGRFALARLGSEVELHSKMQGKESILWQTDWNVSTLDRSDRSENGTRIVIRDLRDHWTPAKVRNLQYFLSRTYNDDVMKIWLEYQGTRTEVKKYFQDFTLGVHGVSIIRLDYSAKKQIMTCKIESDEFKEEAMRYCPEINLKKVLLQLNMVDELIGYSDDMTQDDLTAALKRVGSFHAELYFSLKNPSSVDADKFLYKYRFLNNRYEQGVILYRNSFSISSYEGKKDWLGFGARSRMSPAAASHPTGSWRVRENQISGKVVIDKRENCDLRDLANRQGLEENDSYKLFIQLILSGIQCFERYRQNIIRHINKKNAPEEPASLKIIEKVLKSPESLTALTLPEQGTFLAELKTLQKENKESRRQMSEQEEHYRYDIRLLNLFATSGLKATSIAHDMYNNRNSLDENVNYIISALKQYELWDIVDSEENKRYIHRNIPGLLAKNQRLNKKMVNFMTVLLSESEKEQFNPEEIDVYKLMTEIKNVWEKDYAWIRIDLDMEKDIIHKSAKDIFWVIFDNLILNSVQQNDYRNGLDIYIRIIQQGRQLQIEYSDNGAGLPPKYILDPMRILEVHETSRKNGHGIGMWIVNNTVRNTAGEILNIDGNKGFKFLFTLGDKL